MKTIDEFIKIKNLKFFSNDFKKLKLEKKI